MSQNDERIVPAAAVHDLLGIRRPTLIPAAKAVNIRKLVVVDDETGAENVYLSAVDLAHLLDREYEVTEAKEIRQMGLIVRRLGGLA